MAEFSSLCPGYKQVDAFGPDEEYEEEEVVYVTLDLGNAEPSLIPSSSHYRLIGLDTPTPFLQLSGTILKGRHDTLLGTELLFTDGKDPSDSSKRVIVHVANTEQRIMFKEVQLKQKKDTDAMPVEKDGKLGVDDITGKNEPSQRRVRAPRRPREAPPPPSPQVEDSGEAQGSGETHDIAEEKSAPEVLAEEPAATEGVV
ncbi:hypothetical protein C8R45DRAFT_858306 [Mycena sanguinolenta]|nr:hypothetical protein C8R45DRAFT_858306 [Mycena sanguinolenta]